MSDTSSSSEDPASDKPSVRPIAAEEVLPPVEPPTMGFVFQLFVIPAIIVTIIAVVWVMFSWLAHMGNSPEKMITDLESGRGDPWQYAWNLASELGKPGNESLKRDHATAERLGDFLVRHLEAGNTDEHDTKLRLFLARALGEFQVTDGLPSLILAVTTERNANELEVRQSALEAIAVLTGNVGADAMLEDDDLMPALQQAAGQASDSVDHGEQRSALRSVAAYAMGVLGNDESLDSLELLLSDAHPNVRYNAATGLARNGDERAIRVLLEMLDTEDPRGIESEEFVSGRDFKRALITVNALRAVSELASRNADSDLAELDSAIDRLLAGDVDNKVVLINAKQAKSKLAERPLAASGS